MKAKLYQLKDNPGLTHHSRKLRRRGEKTIRTWDWTFQGPDGFKVSQGRVPVSKNSIYPKNKILDIVITKNPLKPTGSFQVSHHTHIKRQLCVLPKKVTSYIHESFYFPGSIQCRAAPLLFHLTFRTQGHNFTYISYLTDTLYSVQ